MSLCCGFPDASLGAQPLSIDITTLPDTLGRTDRFLSRQTGVCYYAPSSVGYGAVRAVLAVPQSHVLIVAPVGCTVPCLPLIEGTNLEERVHKLFLKSEQLVDDAHIAQVYEAAHDVIQTMRPRALTIVYSCLDDSLDPAYQALAEDLEENSSVPVRATALHPSRKSDRLPLLAEAIKTVYSYLPNGQDDGTKRLNCAGIFAPLDPTSEVHEILARQGYRAINASACSTFDEFLSLANVQETLVMADAALYAAKLLKQRMGMPGYRWPVILRPEDVAFGYQALSHHLGCPLAYAHHQEEESEKIAALVSEGVCAGKTFSIGSSHSQSPLELARMIEEAHGRVEEIYLSHISEVDECHLPWLKANAPHVKLVPTSPRTALALRARTFCVDVALGRDAALNSNATGCVDLSYNRVHFGFAGARSIFEAIRDAQPVGEARA